MKKFEPIVIQKKTNIFNEITFSPPKDADFIFDIVVYTRSGEYEIGLTREAAIRLRDALNKILED